MSSALAADQAPQSRSPPPPLGRLVQDHLGQHLRATYEAFRTSPVPKDLRSILARFERVLSSDAEVVDPAFRDGLSAALPSLRAFALYLTRHNERADDLVQDTMMKAWDKRAGFRPGTNLNAWLFTILRNSYCSERRKRLRELQDTDGEYAASLITPPDQIDCLQLEDLRAAVERLCADQREALLLVGVEGLAYEEVAAICRCPVGTIKSRVNRARIRLAQLMRLEDGDWASDKLLWAARGGGRRP